MQGGRVVSFMFFLGMNTKFKLKGVYHMYVNEKKHLPLIPMAKKMKNIGKFHHLWQFYFQRMNF